MFQTFVAPMKCPVCGVLTKDATTMMQVRELPSPVDPPLYLKVGDRVRMRFDGVTRADFRVVRDASKAKTFRLLQAWRCPSCKTGDQWAIVEMKADDSESVVISSIAPAPRSKETLAKVDAIAFALEHTLEME